MRKLNPSIMDNYAVEYADYFRRTVGVICLTEERNNILMYAHYSDKHRGFAIELDTSNRKLVTGNFKSVVYSNQYPKINFFKSSADQKYEAFALTKADCWSYEKEWRIVSIPPEGAGSYLTFNRDLISGIIFGCNISEGDKTKIKNLLLNYENVIYYQARTARDVYSLNIIQE